MTACVKNHSRRVALAVSASLVGALSLGAATVPAFADITTLDVPASTWSGVDFTWNAEGDKFGTFTVETGDQLLLTGAKDFAGNQLSMSDLTVIYVKDNNGDGTVNDGDLYWTTTPEGAGKYMAIVFNGRGDLDGSNANLGSEPGKTLSLSSLGLSGMQSETFDFQVVAKSIAGAYAYQGDDVSDTTFMYTGNDLFSSIHFADADGNKLDSGDFTVSGPTSVTSAGDYIFTLTGINEYSGTATVKVTVDKIDLSTAVVTVDPVGKSDGAFTAGKLYDSAKVFVNGEPVNPSIFDINNVSAEWPDGIVKEGTAFAGTHEATVHAEVSVRTGGGNKQNFVDASAKATTTILVVTRVLTGDFFYDGQNVNQPTPSTYANVTIDTSKGEELDTSLVAGYVGTEKVPTTTTVYKGGKVVTDYSEPGTYTVKVQFDAPDDLSYAGTTTFTATVISKHYNEKPQVFASVDGKDLCSGSASVEYDGKAIEPVVVAKAGSTTLVEGEDYTVTYTDKDGNAVEEIVEPGEYNATVDFGNAYYWDVAASGHYSVVPEVNFTVTVTKAQLRSAKADKDVYAYVEDQAVTPVFTAYNKGDLSGLSLEIDPAQTGVSYFELKLGKNGKPVAFDPDTMTTTGASAVDAVDVDGDKTPDYVLDNATPIKASDLTEEGWYVAQLTAPADDPHFQGQVYSQPFQVSTYAVYADVDASAWYAQDVYNAKEQGYMTGIAGTDLFMPEANITRGEIAKVFFNMAGVEYDEGYTSPSYVPTKFADVDAWAWYAEPIAWASNAGVVTGYLGTDNFGPNDQASREQVAAMIYRYAQAQGKDMTVDDADAALAAYTDGSQVSDWAKTAMAWCVENGVFGQNTTELKPQDNIQRAQVASIAVRVQPEALPHE